MRKRRPNRTKTFADVTRLEGTEFHQLENGITFYLEDTAVDRMMCCGDLLGRFYEFNEGQQPLHFGLIEDRTQSIPEKVWHVIMRGSFYMDIEQGRELEGPHRCRLWFRTCFAQHKQNHWIASLQLMAFYFNEQQMKDALLAAMTAKEFFMLPSNLDKPIIL